MKQSTEMQQMVTYGQPIILPNYCQPQVYRAPQIADIPIQEQPTLRNSQILMCKGCQRPVESEIKYKYGKGAGFLSLLLGTKLLLCCIPCFFKECKDAVHVCPVCQEEIGRKRFLFE